MTDTAAETITDVEVLPPEQAVALLTDKAKADAFFTQVAERVRAHVPDLTTVTGRKALASEAYKVAQTRAALDKARLERTKDLRAEIDTINATSKSLIDRFADLRDEVRKPLTDWEDAEKAREDKRRETIEWIKAAGVITIDDTAAAVTERLIEIEGIEIDEEEFGEHTAIAQAERKRTIEALTAGAARLEAQEAERAELDRLRKEREAREAADAAAAQAKAEEEAAAERERQAEERRRATVEQFFVHVEAAKGGRINGREVTWAVVIHELEAVFPRWRQETDFKDRAEEADKAVAEALEVARGKAAEEKVAADKAAQEAAERAAEQAAAKARAAAEAAAEAARKAEEAAAERRAANRRHASKIMREAKEAIMAAGSVEEGAAALIVKAIVDGKIAHTAITF